MDHTVEERMGEIARRQHGVVTCAQLYEVGLRTGAVRRRARAGRLRRLHRGVYLVGPIVQPRTREMAAVLACGCSAVLSHRSAAMLWGAVAPAEALTVPDVGVTCGHDRRRSDIRVHRLRLAPDETTILDSIPITTPPRTFLDLASVVGASELERALATAERERIITRDRLLVFLTRHCGHPGTRRLHAALEREGGPALTRSEAESRFLDLIRRARLPAPEVNAAFDAYEIDFLWRSEGIALEVDGYTYHATRPRFESDRRRASRLAALGIHVIPITWRQIVEDGLATAVQLAQALTYARQRSVGSLVVPPVRPQRLKRSTP